VNITSSPSCSLTGIPEVSVSECLRSQVCNSASVAPRSRAARIGAHHRARSSGNQPHARAVGRAERGPEPNRSRASIRKPPPGCRPRAVSCQRRPEAATAAAGVLRARQQEPCLRPPAAPGGCTRPAPQPPVRRGTAPATAPAGGVQLRPAGADAPASMRTTAAVGAGASRVCAGWVRGCGTSGSRSCGWRRRAAVGRRRGSGRVG
jgi:hypothetical protein